MKSKLWYLLGIILLTIVIVMIAIPKYPNIDKYMTYLNRYEQEIVIKTKLKDTSNIDTSMFNISTFRDVEQEFDNYFCGYICALKNEPNIEFVVGWGKFSDGKLPFKTKQFVDNYAYVIREHLNNKYSKTLIITNEYSSIDAATKKVEQIYKQCLEDFINYGLEDYNFYMLFDIEYNGKLIKNVEIWDFERIKDILVNATYSDYK